MLPTAFAQILEAARATKGDLERRIARQALDMPAWTNSNDARVVGMQGLLSVLRFTELSLVFVEWHLGDVNWWVRLRGERPTIQQLTFEYGAYTQGAKFGVFHLAAASFENSLRSLLRALAPEAANNSRAEFKRVYDCLLTTHLRFPDEDIQLLDLVRLVRNTIHNEGIHRPPSGSSTTVLYRGTTYPFHAAGPMEFVSWPFVIERLADLVDLLDRVVRSPEVSAYKETIPADWATILPSPGA